MISRYPSASLYRKTITAEKKRNRGPLGPTRSPDQAQMPSVQDTQGASRSCWHIRFKPGHTANKNHYSSRTWPPRHTRSTQYNPFRRTARTAEQGCRWAWAAGRPSTSPPWTWTSAAWLWASTIPPASWWEESGRARRRRRRWRPHRRGPCRSWGRSRSRSWGCRCWHRQPSKRPAA